MTTASKIKVGDKVRFKDTPDDNRMRQEWHPSSTKETVFTVTSEKVDGFRRMINVNNDGANWYPQRFELVTETDPKALKVGDVVRFKDTLDDQTMRHQWFPQTTKDTTFTITKANPTGTVRLNHGYAGFLRRRFELVKAAPKLAYTGVIPTEVILGGIAKKFLEEAPKAVPLQSHIVVLKDSKGMLKPANTPFVHVTKEAAEKEAARLAKEHPGQTFVVFSSVNEAAAPAPVVTVTKHATV